MFLRTVCVFSCILAVGWCQLDCSFVERLDCTSYGISPECGTDGKDYQNRCYFAKAQCKDNNLHIQADGTCSDAGFTTPAGTTLTTTEPLFLGHNAVQDFLCLELMHQVCVMDTEMLCASDGNTYNNFCEFQKQRCAHRDLTVIKYGACTQ